MDFCYCIFFSFNGIKTKLLCICAAFSAITFNVDIPKTMFVAT